MSRAKPFRLVFVCSLLVFIAACGGGGGNGSGNGTTSGKDSLTVVHIGTLGLAGYSSVWLADSEGFLKSEGLSASFDKITDPSNGVANIVSGRLQFSLLTPGSMAVALSQKLPVKEVAPLYFNNSDQQVFVTKDSPIKSMKDLAGKTIAVGGINNSTVAGINIQLSAAGVDPKSVKYVLIPISTTAGSLLSGKVDAAQIAEPNITLNEGKLRSIVPNLLKPFGEKGIFSVLVTSANYASQNPEIVGKFQRAMAKAQNFAAKNPDAVRRSIATHTDIAASALKKMILPGFAARLDEAGQIKQAQGMVEQGFVAKMPDMSGAIIHNSVFGP